MLIMLLMNSNHEGNRLGRLLRASQPGHWGHQVLPRVMDEHVGRKLIPYISNRRSSLGSKVDECHENYILSATVTRRTCPCLVPQPQSSGRCLKRIHGSARMTMGSGGLGGTMG